MIASLVSLEKVNTIDLKTAIEKREWGGGGTEGTY